MMRTRLMLGTLFTVLLATMAVPPARAEVRVGVAAAVVVTPQDHQLETALAVGLLAAFFDVPVAVVVPLYPRYGFDNSALLLAIFVNSGRPIAFIEREHSRGIGWGEVAHRCGVHPGVFNQQRVWAKKNDGPVAVSFGNGVLGRCYGIAPASVQTYRNRGYAFPHILLGLNVSRQTGHSMEVVLKSRERESSWAATGKHFGVNAEKVKSAPAPKQKFGKGKGNSQGQGNQGKGGPGNSGGKGKGKGKGNPHH